MVVSHFPCDSLYYQTSNEDIRVLLENKLFLKVCTYLSCYPLPGARGLYITMTFSLRNEVGN